jgi:Transglutaminase-like superfamily/TgpA N-terminal domain
MTTPPPTHPQPRHPSTPTAESIITGSIAGRLDEGPPPGKGGGHTTLFPNDGAAVGAGGTGAAAAGGAAAGGAGAGSAAGASVAGGEGAAGAGGRRAAGGGARQAPVGGRLLWSGGVLAVGAAQLGVGWVGLLPVGVFIGAIVATYGCVLGARAAGIRGGFTAVGVLVLAIGGSYLVAGAATVRALTDLVPRLLTAPRPASATPGLLLPGVLLVVVVALVVALAVLGNGRALIIPAVGGATLYTAAALLTAGQADRRGLVALGMVVLVGVGWLVLDRSARGGRRAGRAYLVPPAALLALLAGSTLLAGVLPMRDGFEPRDLVKRPVTDLDVPSPLPQLASWAAAADTELFRVRGPDVPLRLVALSDFTGATWRAASLYGPIGAVAPPDLPDGARSAGAEIDVTIGALAGPWLPTAGRATATSAGDAVVDPDSGSLVLREGTRPGLRYQVTSTVDAPDDGDLLTAGVPGGVAARRYLALPGLPFSLAEYARRTVVNAHTAFEQAVAIEEVVRAGRRTDAQAPVGSSYARLETFLFGAPGTAGAGAGTAEQFAAAFAVLARAVGLPSRMVVGFRPPPPGPDGVTVVHGGDATAWPEVYFAGWGWVPFDPIPGSSGGGSTSNSKRDVINRLATPTPTPSISSTTGPELPVPSPAREPDATAAAAAREDRPPYGLLLLGLVPLGAAALLGSLRTARRLRLRRAGATGAWSYVLDSLLLAGRTPPRHQPAPDIARNLAGLTPAAGRLAELAERAAFAPGPAPPAITLAAWPLALQVRAGLRRVVPWYRRAFWAIDPRPLWRR